METNDEVHWDYHDNGSSGWHADCFFTSGVRQAKKHAWLTHTRCLITRVGRQELAAREGAIGYNGMDVTIACRVRIRAIHRVCHV